MKFILILICFYYCQISIIFSIKSKNLEVCQHFLINKNNKCKKKSFIYLHSDSSYKVSSCVCRDMNVTPTWTNSTVHTLANLNNDYLPFYVYFKITKKIILEKKLPIFNQEFLNIDIISPFFIFRYIKGFDINSYNKSFTLKTVTRVFFYDSILAFYSNGRQLKSCDDFPSQPRSFLNMFNVASSATLAFIFYNVKYQSICPLAFANNEIEVLTMDHLCETFYRKNLPYFTHLPKNITNIDSKVYRLTLNGYGEIQMNFRIINPHVFNLTTEFNFYLKLSKIERGFFKSFKNTQEIFFSVHYWQKLAQNGIEWINDLNSHIRVDLNDTGMILNHFKNGIFVKIFCIRREHEYAVRLKPINAFPNKDFCIYANFPFNQMVVWYSAEVSKRIPHISCTLVWLLQPKIPRERQNLKFYIKIFNKCNFNER